MLHCFEIELCYVYACIAFVNLLILYCNKVFEIFFFFFLYDFKSIILFCIAYYFKSIILFYIAAAMRCQGIHLENAIYILQI